MVSTRTTWLCNSRRTMLLAKYFISLSKTCSKWLWTSKDVDQMICASKDKIITYSVSYTPRFPSCRENFIKIFYSYICAQNEPKSICTYVGEFALLV